MNTPKTIGFIKCGKKQLAADSSLNGSRSISKIFIRETEDLQQCMVHYPEAEIVHTKEPILNDTTIDHVIFYEPGTEDMKFVAEVLQSGKNVQILKN